MIAKKWIILILSLLSVVILLPPLIHGYIYPNGGDDAGFHIMVMQSITLTHIPPTIYAGQWLVGYPLMLLNHFFHISITGSFMWFNYLVLIVLVWSDFFVFSLLFNRNVGLLVGVASFLVVITNLHLFLAGQIFNIINIGIILPWLLYFIAKAIKADKSQKPKYVLACLGVGLVFGVFHATGIYGVPIMALALIADWQNKRFKTEGIIVLAMMAALAVILLVMSLPIWHLSPDAGRQGVDGLSLVLLVIVALVGWKFTTGKQAIYIVLGVIAIGSIYQLPTWLSYINALQPVDKEAIAYIKTLPESEFYGNGYLASWVYEPYLDKTYKADSSIYVWRSKPMTAMTTPDYVGWWNPEQTNISPPPNVKNEKTFEGGGITIYVAETAN